MNLQARANPGTEPGGGNGIAVRIIEFIRSEELPVGSHLPAQLLGNRLKVSRTPVNDALARLERHGVLRHEKNRGYFLARRVEAIDATMREALGSTQGDELTRVYFRIADDLLQGQLPPEVSEAQLRNRYQLTDSQLRAVLRRIATEGWVQKKPGYGWAFASMLTTPESLLQSYRLRIALEPAALLEPGYRLDPKVLQRCREAELRLLEGGIDTATPDQLHERGVRFHEALVEASGNPFFIDAIRRVNRVRRLISYRSMQDRTRHPEHCRQHLHILELLEAGNNEDAAKALREHLSQTLVNHRKIRGILDT